MPKVFGMDTQQAEAGPDSRPKRTKPDTDASRLIDQLGGTSEVAALCDIKPPSVSEWRVKGIPKARLKFFKLLRPDLFAEGSGEPVQEEHAA